jgi:hypothetical protein
MRVRSDGIGSGRRRRRRRRRRRPAPLARGGGGGGLREQGGGRRRDWHSGGGAEGDADPMFLRGTTYLACFSGSDGSQAKETGSLSLSTRHFFCGKKTFHEAR